MINGGPQVSHQGYRGHAMSLAELVGRVVDKAPPLTARQLASIAALLRQAVDPRGEHHR